MAEEEAGLQVVPTRRLPAAISLIALAIAACSSTQASPSPATASPSQAGATGTPVVVMVELQEWAVLPATDSVAAGSVTFHAANIGPNNPHELVVLKTDLDPGALPISGPGMVDEFDAGIEVLDEIEELAVGANAQSTVTLAAGKYILVCNVYDESGAHYKLGMRTAFTVTE